MARQPFLRLGLVAVAAVGLAGLAATAFLFLRLTSVERGRRLAETQGCFACHGPEGTRGAGNPGRSDRTVPTYGSLMMYATNREEVRQWIADGVSRTRAQSETWECSRCPRTATA